MSIVSVAAFADYVRNEAYATDVGWLQAALDAAEAGANQHCQRQFVVAGAATARLYRPRTQGSAVLRIHDCTTVTVVTDNSSTVTSTEYQLEPLNGIDWAGQTHPYEQISRLGGVWSWSVDGQALISVTATWGWAAIPSEVTQAVYILAKDLASQRDMRAGVAAFGEYGAVRARENPAVAALLDPFRRVEAFGAG